MTGPLSRARGQAAAGEPAAATAPLETTCKLESHLLLAYDLDLPGRADHAALHDRPVECKKLLARLVVTVQRNLLEAGRASSIALQTRKR